MAYQHPSNILNWWNVDSRLGLCLLIQLITGIIPRIHYTANINIEFERIIHVCGNVNYGLILCTIHVNGTSVADVYFTQ